MPDGNAPARNTGNVVSIILGVLLFVGVLGFKYFAPGKVAVGFSDVLLLALPVLLWLLASGQLESLKVGTSGFQIKSAILKATGTSIISR